MYSRKNGGTYWALFVSIILFAVIARIGCGGEKREGSESVKEVLLNDNYVSDSVAHIVAKADSVIASIDSLLYSRESSLSSSITKTEKRINEINNLHDSAQLGATAVILSRYDSVESEINKRKSNPRSWLGRATSDSR